MSIYVISDLHLSFNTDKPMDVFGWNNYEEKIANDWNQKVTDNDLVILPGDFSWEINLEDTYKDFEFINNLPGKKLLLKGNHDYWWNTLTKMRKFLNDNNFSNIDFIYNNSYIFDDTIICGTRGWTLIKGNEEDEKVRRRELLRLEMSIKDGIEKYGEDKEKICCMHYPPLSKNNKTSEFTDILDKYKIGTCVYGHLHGKEAHETVLEGKINNTNYLMTSCDYTGFKLIKIK